jgi:hypothetical protein
MFLKEKAVFVMKILYKRFFGVKLHLIVLFSANLALTTLQNIKI